MVILRLPFTIQTKLRIMKIKVLIADDHQLFREGISNLLFPIDNIEVIGQAENGIEAIKYTQV